MVPANSPFLQVDHEQIVRLIEPGATVLDLGCGEGTLLQRLAREKNVTGLGVEIDEENVIRSLSKGVSVIQADIDERLVEFGDNTFDVVILSQTLQVVLRPDFVLREMLRIGRQAIVSFPNYGHWRIRLQTLFSGRRPQTAAVPFSWYETPNIHLCTMIDFRRFCREHDIEILREVAVARHARFGEFGVSVWPNLLAEEGIFVIARG